MDSSTYLIILVICRISRVISLIIYYTVYTTYNLTYYHMDGGISSSTYADGASTLVQVQGMDSDGHFQIINAEVPLANLHDYATALKSMSSGRGMFSNEFSHYEDMPHAEAKKVISEWETSRAAGE